MTRARGDKTASEGAARTLRTAQQRQRSGDAPPTPLTRVRTRAGQSPALRRLAGTAVAAGPRAAGPLPVVLMGDAAGGALALTLARHAAMRGITVAGVAALSPRLDATLRQGAVDDVERRDPVLAGSGLRAAGRARAVKCSPDDPDVGPAYADPGQLAGAGPIALYIGCHDILRPAVAEFARGAAETGGAALTVHEVTAMFHVWMTSPVPEGRPTRRELGILVADRAEQAGPAP